MYIPERRAIVTIDNSINASVYNLLSTLFSLLAVLFCDLVFCPRTGSAMACRLPLYVPVSRSL